METVADIGTRHLSVHQYHKCGNGMDPMTVLSINLVSLLALRF